MVTVPCPICKTPVIWSDDSPYRPFCSQTCKTRDLGAWATESYRIHTEEGMDIDQEIPSSSTDSAF